MCQYIFFHVNPRSNFNQFHSVRSQFKNSAFRNIEYRLSYRVCIIATESNLFNLFEELLVSAFLCNDQLPILNNFFKSTSCKCTAINHFF